MGRVPADRAVFVGVVGSVSHVWEKIRMYSSEEEISYFNDSGIKKEKLMVVFATLRLGYESDAAQKFPNSGFQNVKK